MPFFKFFIQMSWKIILTSVGLAAIFMPVAFYKEIRNATGEFGSTAIILVVAPYGVWLSCLMVESISKTWRQRHQKSFLDLML